MNYTPIIVMAIVIIYALSCMWFFIIRPFLNKPSLTIKIHKKAWLWDKKLFGDPCKVLEIKPINQDRKEYLVTMTDGNNTYKIPYSESQIIPRKTGFSQIMGKSHFIEIQEAKNKNEENNEYRNDELSRIGRELDEARAETERGRRARNRDIKENMESFREQKNKEQPDDKQQQSTRS